MCFRVIDENGKSFEIKTPQRLDTFSFGTLLLVSYESGVTNNFSFLQLAVNEKELAE